MRFQEWSRFIEDGIEYVNVLQMESGYDRNIPASDWDHNPQAECSKIAKYLRDFQQTPVIVKVNKPPLEFSIEELVDSRAIISDTGVQK